MGHGSGQSIPRTRRTFLGLVRRIPDYVCITELYTSYYTVVKYTQVLSSIDFKCNLETVYHIRECQKLHFVNIQVELIRNLQFCIKNQKMAILVLHCVLPKFVQMILQS